MNVIFNQMIPFYAFFSNLRRDDRLNKPNGSTFLEFNTIHARTFNHDCNNNCPIR